jgi:hypothetical protein
MSTKYQKNELILLLKKLANDINDVPKKSILKDYDYMPSEMAFRTAFGSWGNALLESGFVAKKFIPLGARKGKRNKKGLKRILNINGYIQIFEPTHPLSCKNGYVLEHRKILYDNGLMKDISNEVHHINGIKTDNRVENLISLTKEEHASITWKGVKRSEKGNDCRFCLIKTRSRYGLCKKHYKLEWQRNNIHQNPELLEQSK